MTSGPDATLILLGFALRGSVVAFGVDLADWLVRHGHAMDWPRYGDTIEIQGSRIRLFGIDAPESSQLCRDDDSKYYRCGQQAANALFDFIANRVVGCIEVDRGPYGRVIAVCSVDWRQSSDGVDLDRAGLGSVPGA